MKVSVNGDSCEASGHPSSCTEPAPGEVEASGKLTLNGKAIASHDDVMHFDSHAHEYSDINSDGSNECHNFQSHDLVPDQSPAFSHNGEPIMRVGDDTSDPGSGGTASITSSSESGLTHQ